VYKGNFLKERITETGVGQFYGASPFDTGKYARNKATSMVLWAGKAP